MADKISGLCDFLAAVGHSGTVARLQCEKAAMASITRYISEPDQEGISELKTRKIRIGDTILNVPLLGLAPTEHLDLKGLEISFDTVVDMKLPSEPHHDSPDDSPDDSPNASTDDSIQGNPKISIGLTKGLLKKGTEINIKAVYELREATETSEQIRDKINKKLSMEG